MILLNDHKAEIEYPLKWTYKIIGLDAPAMEAAVANCIKKEYDFSLSHVSSGGKYQSFSVDVVVENEEERLELFSVLSAHPDILRII